MTDTPYTLVFQKNSHSGMPELAEQHGRIPPQQLAGWQNVLRKEYERLRRGKESSVTFPTAAGGLPQTWHVTSRRDDRRMPTLILHPAEPESGTGSGLPSSEPQRPQERPDRKIAGGLIPDGWREEMLAELDRLLDRVPLDRGQRPAVDYVLEELQQAVADAPAEMLLVLFAGYLHACGRMCRLQGRNELTAYYSIAGQVVGELCEAALPADLLRDISQKTEANAGWPDRLHWPSLLLTRLTGLRRERG